MARLAILIILIAATTAAGPGRAEMYSARELAADRSRLQARIAHLHDLLTLPQFLAPSDRWLADVAVLTPDVAPDGDPMGFSAYEGRVYMPVAGLKFIEDLTMAYAWRFRSERTLEPFDEYLAMLRWKPEPEWPDGAHLDPLEAFGVPDRIWETDPDVGDLGTSLRNEAWAFLLAHELAHVLYAHPGNQAPAAVSQANESEADAFALNLLMQTGDIPMGAILYFQATAAFYSSRADLPSDRAYARWQREVATHPVNSQRLLAMARKLQLLARQEGDATRADALHFIGAGLEQFARDLDDPAMQQLIVRRAVSGDPRDLQGR